MQTNHTNRCPVPTYIQPVADLQDTQGVLEDVIQRSVAMAAGDPQNLHIWSSEGNHDGQSIINSSVNVKNQLLHPTVNQNKALKNGCIALTFKINPLAACLCETAMLVFTFLLVYHL
ncbi:hypothetical protein ILYODFUR_024353 [Ilyodon furcidens]|uniref:Uncharacterized protein n=1 Tax=Ilyodon furcidens TaxID=33524 RepID=A0ABV0UC72_9TELE